MLTRYFQIVTNPHQSSLTFKKDESSFQQHALFWDKANKGYVTPLDTVSGFITLGYGMVFSIAVGATVGILLSLTTQKGWFPDPLCRSNVRHLIRAKKESLSNTGAYDEGGVFNLDKFEALFNKYAKSDPSGNTMTLIELAQMTREQEQLGNNVRAWAAGLFELCTAYFFIGHRGSLNKEDVRAAYDGSLFYRLTDENRLRIQDRNTILKGNYLSKPTAMLSPKALEHRLEVLLSSLQSKSSFLSEYGINEWITYVQDKAKDIKMRAWRRPASMIHGVTTPKGFKHMEEDNDNLEEPSCLTGVLKEEEHSVMIHDYLSGLLSGEMDTVAHIKHSPAMEEENEPFSFVLCDEEPTVSTLTGVQGNKLKEEEEENLASLSSSTFEEPAEVIQEEKIPEATITPPPEEKIVIEKPIKKMGKKAKRKNKQNHDMDSGQLPEPTAIH